MGWRRFLLVTLCGLALLAPTVRARNMLDCGGSSRLATAESLVEHGSFAIDRSTFDYTCDRMRLEGHIYSDKPPLLSVAAAGVYAVLHHGLGLSFNPDADPNVNTVKDPCYYLMTLLVSTLAVALTGALVDRELRRRGLSSGAALGGAGLVVFGTLLWPLSSLFTNHTVASVLLLAGLLQAAGAESEAAGSRGSVVSGMLLGLLFAVDLPLGGLALGMVGLVQLRRGWRRLAAYAVGAALPVAAHLMLNLAIVGDLMPFQTHRELYDELTGHAGASASGFELQASRWLHLLRNTVGSLGWLSVTPVLIPSLAGSVVLARGRGPQRLLARLSLGLTASLLVIYGLIYPQAVGCSYGMRHLAPLTPPLLVLGLDAVRQLGRGFRRGLLVAAAVSVVLSGGGVLVPTTCAGFVEDARALIPARVFGAALQEGVVPRLKRLFQGRSPLLSRAEQPAQKPRPTASTRRESNQNTRW
jgi:hypothetical protein